jgi:hypothetical protein
MPIVYHPLIEAYKANKVQYDTDYFLSYVSRTVFRNPQLEDLRTLPEFKALMAKIYNHEPFRVIVYSLDEMTLEDLKWLAANMPSGWHRSQVLERLDGGTPG